MTASASSQAAPASSSRTAAAAAVSRGAGAAASLPGGHELRVRGVQVPDPVQPRGRPVLQLGGVRVAGPDEIPPDVSPAVQVDQAVRLLPGGLVNGVEVAGDHQPPRPAIVIRGELPGLLVDAGVAGQDRPGPGGVHDEAGGVRAEEHPQPPFRRAVALARGQDPPRRLVGVQVPRAPATAP